MNDDNIPYRYENGDYIIIYDTNNTINRLVIKKKYEPDKSFTIGEVFGQVADVLYLIVRRYASCEQFIEQAKLDLGLVDEQYNNDIIEKDIQIDKYKREAEYLQYDKQLLTNRINKALHKIQLLQMDGEVTVKDLGIIVNRLKGDDEIESAEKE